MTALELSFGPVSDQLPRVASYELARGILCVATEVSGGWAAYVAAVDGDAAGADEWVLAHGRAMPDGVARCVFENVSWCRGWPYIFDAQRGAEEVK